MLDYTKTYKVNIPLLINKMAKIIKEERRGRTKEIVCVLSSMFLFFGNGISIHILEQNYPERAYLQFIPILITATISFFIFRFWLDGEE